MITELGDFTIPVLIFCAGIAIGTPLVFVLAIFATRDIEFEEGEGTSAMGKR